MVTSATAVATWNVLHRVHAENWSSHVLDRWPDEAERIAAVSARVAGTSEAVIALQEVSGDQLASLRQALPVSRTVHSFRYPRVPKPRRVPTRLSSRDEYLVLVLDGPPGEVVAAEAFATDPGKGLLAVRAGGLLLVATHVSTGPRRPAQLARLAEVVAAAGPGPAVLLGDFNADRATVATELGPGFTIAPLPPDAAPTRPRDVGAEKSVWIDHVVTHGADASEAAVEDVHGLSDHNPVRARVAPARQ
jgi:endonuclease/exonuclease/phosphatase family metal-dependent hydrolase